MPASVAESDLLARRILVGCAAVIGGSLGLTLSDYGGWPRLIYQPYQRVWSVTSELPPGVSMVFFGTLLWAVGGAAAASLAVSIGARKWRKKIDHNALKMVAAWAGTAVVLASSYFLWSLFPF